MSSLSLQERVTELYTRNPNPKLDYYFFTLLGKENDKLQCMVYTHWTGWVDDDHRIEIREASLVNAEILTELHRTIGESCAVVNNVNDMEVFLLIGGHGVVEKSIAQSVVPEILKPSPSVQVGEHGFAHPDSLSENAFNKAPTKKQRMRVIKRDGFKCRVCGRRSVDCTDIELHVHHIKPWANRGVTDDENLITLCSTCHGGIEPHYDPSLFRLFEPVDDDQRDAMRRKKYWEGVKQYRLKMSREYLPSNDKAADFT